MIDKKLLTSSLESSSESVSFNISWTSESVIDSDAAEHVQVWELEELVLLEELEIDDTDELEEGADELEGVSFWLGAGADDELVAEDSAGGVDEEAEDNPDEAELEDPEETLEGDDDEELEEADDEPFWLGSEDELDIGADEELGGIDKLPELELANSAEEPEEEDVDELEIEADELELLDPLELEEEITSLSLELINTFLFLFFRSKVKVYTLVRSKRAISIILLMNFIIKIKFHYF